MVEKKNLRIVYMGTPDFAVEALRCLVERGGGCHYDAGQACRTGA